MRVGIRKQAAYGLAIATVAVATLLTLAMALELACRHPGEISLLLTDVVMPQMSGPQLASRLREFWPSLKVLYMSGYIELSNEVDLGRGEAMIQKPFSPAAIAERVREILG